MAFDPLSQEVVYALKGNVAYPVVGAAAAGLQTLAQNRLQDAYQGAGGAPTITLPVGDFVVVKQ